MGGGAASTECCICFEPTRNGVEPCGHLMCKACVVRWAERKTSCPMCKVALVAPCPADEMGLGEDAEAPRIRFDIPPKGAVGLKVRNDREGVRVVAVVCGSLAYEHGLRAGHRITHVNDFPVRRHDAAIAIVDAAQAHAHRLCFTLQRGSKLEANGCLGRCEAAWRSVFG